MFQSNIKNIFIALRNRLLNKESDNKNEPSNNWTSWDIIIGLISTQEIFIFSEENINKISVAKDFIRTIYIEFFRYILSWNFQKHDTKLITVAIEKLINNLNKENSGDVSHELYRSYLWDLEKILLDLKEIQDLKNKIQTKRKYIITPLSDPDTKNDQNNDKSFEQKLFYYLLNINYIQLSMDDDYSFYKQKSIITYLISTYQELSTASDSEEKNKENINLLKDYIVLSLFKLSLISWKNKFDYYENWEIKDFEVQKKFQKSCFIEYEKLLRYIHQKKVNNILFIEEAKENFSKSNKKNSLWIYILLKYYKDIDKSKLELKNIYDNYRKYIFSEISSGSQDENFKHYLNLIFIWNNYLSFLIEEFDKTSNIELVPEIDNFFNELLHLSKQISENSYKNYFTHYKYSYFKNIEYYKKSINPETPYKILKWISDTAIQASRKSLDILRSLNHHCFFEFDIEDFLLDVKIWWKKEQVYVHNMYSFPFKIEEKTEDVTNELNLARENAIDIKYKEKFWKIEEDIEKNKLEAMAVIWIFTGIVVYSIWTIQIFTIIEDLWSAILFSWIFLSGMLFLIWWIFFKSYISIKNEIRYNKWFQLFILALILLSLSFLWKYYYSWTEWALNTNKWNKIYEKLDTKINQAKELKEYLDKKMEDYDKLNKEVKENIKTLKK